MPKYYEDIEEINAKKDMLDKKTPRQCMLDPSIQDDCVRLRVAFFECKRSLLDMRTRFRGRKDY